MCLKGRIRTKILDILDIIPNLEGDKNEKGQKNAGKEECVDKCAELGWDLCV